MPGLGGGLARALGSDNVSVTSKVKNPAIQATIDRALSNYSKYTGGEQTALSDYISKYLGQQGQFEKNVGQESSAIGQFYTGDMANKLAQLRSQREGAVNATADVGVKQALASVDRSRLGEQGGSSSYDQRLAAGAVLPIRTQAALDTANQARSDLGYVTQNQLGLVGQRENLSNALAEYGLAPSRTAAGIEKSDISNLGGITNLDQANKFYGLKKDKNTFADISDTIDSSLLNAMSVYGSMYGGGKGSSYGGAARGGLVWDYDMGGPVRGPGTTHSDSIPINVSHGEYIVPASAVRMPGVLPMLQRIRAVGLASEGRQADPMRMSLEMRRAGGWREPHSYAGGGPVRRWGFADGGSPGSWADFESSYWNADPGGGGGGSPKSGGGGGGGGSALSAISHDLMMRSGSDQTWNWPAATFVPTGGGAPSGGWGMPAAAPAATPTGVRVPPMGSLAPSSWDASNYMLNLWGPKSVPSNFDTLTPGQQQEYARSYARARQMEQGFGPGGNPYE